MIKENRNDISKLKIKFHKKESKSFEQKINSIISTLIKIKKTAEDRRVEDFPVEEYKKLINEMNELVSSPFDNKKGRGEEENINEEYLIEILKCKDYVKFFNSIFKDIEGLKDSVEDVSEAFKTFKNELDKINKII